MNNIWVPPSARKPAQKGQITCKKCGRPVLFVPVAKVHDHTVWSPWCEKCEKPWTDKERRTAQKQINNRKTISKDEYNRMHKNPGKGEFSLPENDPTMKAFIQSYINRHHRVFFKKPNDTSGSTEPADGDQGSVTQRVKTNHRKARRVPAKAN